MAVAMGTEGRIEPAREFLRTALVALGSAIGLALIGYYPTVSLSGPSGVRAMALGIAVALLGGWAGSVPPLALLRRSAREFAAGTLGGLLVRFVGTLGIALGVWALDVVPHVPLLIWVAIAQFVILTVDTIGLIRLGRQVTRGCR